MKGNLILGDEIRRLLDSLADGIYITNRKGYTVYVNRAYEQISNLKATDLVGKHMDELIHLGLFKESASLEVIRKGAAVSILERFCQDQLCYVTASPVFDTRGDLDLVITIVRPMNELNDAMIKLTEVSELNDKYYQELIRLRSDNLNKDVIIGKSRKMREIFDLIKRMANADTTILLQGETGVGKEVVAKEIHKQSNRSDGPFIKVNCAAVPQSLFESEMFGYEKGAFTGAIKDGKAGLIELADKGTLLLDEIGEMDMTSQTKLLRAIQEKKIQRVGGTKAKDVDVRIIAATNKNLRKLVEEERFREDLFYRISVIPITIPPLRNRVEDIELFVEKFLEDSNKRLGTHKQIDHHGLAVLRFYEWPGNVRQLRNLIERMVVTSPNQVIDDKFILLSLGETGMMERYIFDNQKLATVLENIEYQLISESLQKYKTTRAAARALGISQSSIVKKAKKLNISTVNKDSKSNQF